MGLLIDATGYPAAIVVLLLAGAVQGVAIWRIGDRPADLTCHRLAARQIRLPAAVARQFACSAAFNAMPWPVRRSASTPPVSEFRRYSSPPAPDSSGP